MSPSKQSARLATWEWAVSMVGRGGTVNFFGGCPAAALSVWIPACCTIPRSPEGQFPSHPRLHSQSFGVCSAAAIFAGRFHYRAGPLSSLPEVLLRGMAIATAI